MQKLTKNNAKTLLAIIDGVKSLSSRELEALDLIANDAPSTKCINNLCLSASSKIYNMWAGHGVDYSQKIEKLEKLLARACLRLWGEKTLEETGIGLYKWWMQYNKRRNTTIHQAGRILQTIEEPEHDKYWDFEGDFFRMIQNMRDGKSLQSAAYICGIPYHKAKKLYNETLSKL